MGSWRQWSPYVPVSQRRARGQKYAQQQKRKGKAFRPVCIEGRSIAKTFWGQAWCDNLEQYSDYENRLPRGRTYVRNGSVLDLQIVKGKVTAVVSGSQIYRIEIKIAPLKPALWTKLRTDCANSIDSLFDLLQGKLSQGVMERITRPDGLFPHPREITKSCSCPDWADMCKHVAAALYGVGARLDEEPQLLFTLRGVDHLELVANAATAGNLDKALSAVDAPMLTDVDLGAMFGIEMEAESAQTKPAAVKPARSKRVAKKLPLRKEPAEGTEATSAVDATKVSKGTKGIKGVKRTKGTKRIKGTKVAAAAGPIKSRTAGRK